MAKRRWIAKATKRKGGLRRALRVPKGKRIPASKLKAKRGDSTKLRRQKALARTLAKLRKRRG